MIDKGHIGKKGKKPLRATVLERMRQRVGKRVKFK